MAGPVEGLGGGAPKIEYGTTTAGASGESQSGGGGGDCQRGGCDPKGVMVV